MIREDGTFFNEADARGFEQKFNLDYQAISNGAGVLSARFVVAGESDYYLALDVPEGRSFVLFSRSLSTQEGLFYVDVVSGADNGGGTTTGTAKKTLRQGATETIQTDLLLNANAPSGEIVEEYGLVDTGQGQGSKRATGSVGTEGVIKVFNEKSWLKIGRQDAGDDATCSIALIGWELDTVDL
jgi:hypothetical protein